MSIVAKVIGPKREWRAYKARVHALPQPYRSAVEAIERYLLYFGPGKSDRIQQMLDDLAELFEQSAAGSVPIREVVGEDPVEFAEAFLRNYADTGWVAKERERLTAAIDRAAAESR